MDRILSGLYGTSDNDDEQAKVSRANDFVSRVESGNKAEGYSTEEAVQNYRNVTQGLSDDEFEQVAQDALNQLSPDQRREFAQVIKQQAGVDINDNTDDAQELASLTKQFRSSSTGDFGGLLGGLLGGGSGGSTDDIMGALSGLLGGGGLPGMTGGATSPASAQSGIGGLLSNPIVKMVLGLIAAQAMKRMMGGGATQQQPVARVTPKQGSSNDSGGGIIDAIFGGGNDSNDREPSGTSREPQQDNGGGILDALFGGGDKNEPKQTSGEVDVSRIERDRKAKGL